MKPATRRVVAVQGDSAFGFSGMEVETAARYGLNNIVFIIINNNGVGGGPDELDPEKVPPSAYTPRAHYEKMAEIYGGKGFFVTEPAGVEVWVDGELKATTAGSLAPELHEEVRARGLDPARASARTEVANLTLGSHAIELRRKCYETVKRTLDTTQPQDYQADPVKMEDSLASLPSR